MAPCLLGTVWRARMQFIRRSWRKAHTASKRHCIDVCGSSRPLVAASPFEQWVSKQTESSDVVVTTEIIEKAKHAFNRRNLLYLHHVVAAAFSHLPTQGAARRALKRGDVLVNGVPEAGSNVLAPPLGAVLTAQVGAVDTVLEDLEERLKTWHVSRPGRPEAQFRVLVQDTDAGWAVVHKPAGIHTSPCIDTYSRSRMTFEDYLPALVPPPRYGTCSHRPQVCHRLDFRVAGPVVVATATEAERAIKAAFAERRVGKEYRAVVCGAVGQQGDSFTVDSPVHGKHALTDVVVLRVVPCPHYGSISELSLRPRTGRYHQLRVHCAEVLGAPIVNEDPIIFETATTAWRQKQACPLPPRIKRGKGNLFLQAVEVSLPRIDGVTEGVVARSEVSDRYDNLLQQSQRAWGRGWRTNGEGHSYRTEAEQV